MIAAAIPAGEALRLVDSMMRRAFNGARTPRSRAYMIGTKELLLARAGFPTPACPYSAGTAEFDAYFAGADEGRGIWARHQTEASQ